MKIVALTMITNPTYRQDPWEESIHQMLEVTDHVVVVCGRRKDIQQIEAVFDRKSVTTLYLEWPQPEWSYEELPKHLNFGLEHCKNIDADWVIKFDIDHFVHEKDAQKLWNRLAFLYGHRKMAGRFEKYQFHRATKCYEKGKVPLAINVRHYPEICYGKANGEYTDLCQPVTRTGDSIRWLGKQIEIPVGDKIPERKMAGMGVHVWNYDYTFKTMERSKELIYHFDRSHAKFWRYGYGGRPLDDITPESAWNEFIKMLVPRAGKANKHVAWFDHPKHIQNRIKNIRPEEMGYNLWQL